MQREKPRSKQIQIQWWRKRLQRIGSFSFWRGAYKNGLVSFLTDTVKVKLVKTDLFLQFNIRENGRKQPQIEIFPHDLGEDGQPQRRWCRPEGISAFPVPNPLLLVVPSAIMILNQPPYFYTTCWPFSRVAGQILLVRLRSRFTSCTVT